MRRIFGWQSFPKERVCWDKIGLNISESIALSTLIISPTALVEITLRSEGSCHCSSEEPSDRHQCASHPFLFWRNWDSLLHKMFCLCLSCQALWFLMFYHLICFSLATKIDSWLHFTLPDAEQTFHWISFCSLRRWPLRWRKFPEVFPLWETVNFAEFF